MQTEEYQDGSQEERKVHTCIHLASQSTNEQVKHIHDVMSDAVKENAAGKRVGEDYFRFVERNM